MEYFSNIKILQHSSIMSLNLKFCSSNEKTFLKLKDNEKNKNYMINNLIVKKLNKT
jgi:hypothetical protein